MSAIPPLDLTQQYKVIGAEVDAAVLQILASGRYIGGTHVVGFEEQFAQYIGTSHCVTCNSGTDALFLSLRALEIGPGDEVITTPFSFFATAEVISAVGAKPVFVDIDLDTFNLNLDRLEAAITERTKAIIPVHLFGQAVDMTRLMAIANAHNLAVVEDCAQSAGATWSSQKVGSFGKVGCFSFFPTKNLGACGDGGAVTTNDPVIADRLRILREHGMRVRYYHEDIGVTSRLDAIQAAILQIKLRYLDQWNAQRQAIADRYTHLLSKIPGIHSPKVLAGGTSVWHQYTIRLQSCENTRRCGMTPCSREDRPQCRNWAKEQLQGQGVTTMIYYPVPIHRQTVYDQLNYPLGSMPAAEQAAEEVLSLPMFPELTPEQQDQVVYALKHSWSD